MASSTVNLAVHSRGRYPWTVCTRKFSLMWSLVAGKRIRTLPKEVSISLDAPASDLYKALEQKSGYSIHRLRVTKGSDGSLVPNGSQSLRETGLSTQDTIFVKDLGTLQSDERV